MKKLSIILSLIVFLGFESKALFNSFNSLLQNSVETQKIEKLLLFIEKSDAAFIRNGTEYGSLEATKHLRMKLTKAGNKVKTAKDFIDLIASKSYMSGEPYKMKFKNGTVINTRDILYNELRKLETK